MNREELFDQLREQAVALRRAGKSRREIKENLGGWASAAMSANAMGEAGF